MPCNFESSRALKRALWFPNPCPTNHASVRDATGIPWTLSDAARNDGMTTDKHDRLVAQALDLKKAWLLAVAIRGVGDQLTDASVTIPAYRTWENKALKRHIRELEEDFCDIAKHVLLNWNPSNLAPVTKWFAGRFNAWRNTGFAVFDMGRVQEFEQAVGPLGHRKIMDCPPYAQIVLQGYAIGAGIRHPEYHLGMDLALLYNLFLDAETIIDNAERQQKPCPSEHSQSLGRSVILTCFNLLESFVSGLATAFLMENPNAAESVTKRLQDKNLSLRKRFVLFPSLIVGQPDLLTDTKPPLNLLFGELKERRDSFVHCEPGPAPTKWGYVKEVHFHDVNRAKVQQTVDLTCEAVCLAWKAVHGREQPSWLPKRDSQGRFLRVNVRLHSDEGL